MIKKSNAQNQNKLNYKIEEHLGALSERNSRGWRMELNYMSWNGGDNKFDIRQWNEDHSKMTKGITLSFDELENLKKIIDQNIDFNE